MRKQTLCHNKKKRTITVNLNDSVICYVLYLNQHDFAYRGYVLLRLVNSASFESRTLHVIRQTI